MPPIAYFLGKIVLVLTVSLAEMALIVACGVLLFGLDLPSEPQRWFTFAWVWVLGTVACSFLGIAASSLARSSRSAGAVVNLPYLVLAFISGIFVTPITALPEPLIRIGALFPLKWLGQGFRSVFLPDSMTRYEAGRAWEPGRVALVLAAWCVAGSVLCLATFRWKGRRDG
jgi:ABC-2 type transport system permease protein